MSSCHVYRSISVRRLQEMEEEIQRLRDANQALRDANQVLRDANGVLRDANEGLRDANQRFKDQIQILISVRQELDEFKNKLKTELEKRGEKFN